MHPEPDAHGFQPCARCGHTLFQHSTGMCDLRGCECEGWCATMVAKPLGLWARVLQWILGVLDD